MATVYHCLARSLLLFVLFFFIEPLFPYFLFLYFSCSIFPSNIPASILYLLPSASPPMYFSFYLFVLSLMNLCWLYFCFLPPTISQLVTQRVDSYLFLVTLCQVLLQLPISFLPLSTFIFLFFDFQLFPFVFTIFFYLSTC